MISGVSCILSTIKSSRTSRLITRTGVKTVSINAADLSTKSDYQNFQRYPEIDIDMPTDAEATMPSFTESVKRHLTADRKNVFADRGADSRLPIRIRWTVRGMPPLTHGMPPRSALQDSAPNVGRRSGMKIGHSSPMQHLFVGGLYESGRSRSIMSTSVPKAATNGYNAPASVAQSQ